MKRKKPKKTRGGGLNCSRGGETTDYATTFRIYAGAGSGEKKRSVRAKTIGRRETEGRVSGKGGAFDGLCLFIETKGPQAKEKDDQTPKGKE